MTDPEFQVFVIGGSRTPQQWAGILGYLSRNHVGIVPIGEGPRQEQLSIAHEYLDAAGSAETEHAPMWLDQGVYTWMGEQLGCQRNILTQSWHTLEKLELKLAHPEAVKDLLLGPGSSDLPVRFNHRQTRTGQQEMVVDVRSLKHTVELAKVVMRVRGKVALWEFLGLTQVGDGTIACWDKVSTGLLARLTPDA